MARRLFGWVDDPTPGGTPFDGLVSGAVPDATEMWPVTNVTVDEGEQQLDRNDEIRGRRGNTAPQEFSQAPSVTVQGRLYPAILKKLIALVTGGTPVVTGVAPAALTRKYEPVGFGVSVLPAVHLSVVADAIYRKVAGCQLSELELSFPKAGHATYRAVFVGLYVTPETAAPPTPDFAFLGNDWVYLLRDAEALLGGAVSGIDGLSEFGLTFNNGFEDADPWPMRNRVVTPAAGGDRERILWFPQERVLGSAQTVTGRLSLSRALASEEVKRRLVRAEQLVFEVEGPTLATTPAAKGMFRATAFSKVITGGGPSDLVREGRTSAEYELGMFVDESIGKDIQFELVEAS